MTATPPLPLLLSAVLALVLLAPVPAIRAQDTVHGPERLDADTPYQNIGAGLAHFSAHIVDATPDQLQADWDTPATRALALLANNLRPRSFEEAPETPSHTVGGVWHSMKLPVDSTLLLAWDAQGYDGPAMWFAARWDGARLAVFSSRVDPNAPERWYPLEPGKSSYDMWTAGDLRVEMEVYLPEDMGRTVLYRFRPLDQDGAVAPASPAPPADAPATPRAEAGEGES